MQKEFEALLKVNANQNLYGIIPALSHCHFISTPRNETHETKTMLLKSEQLQVWVFRIFQLEFYQLPNPEGAIAATSVAHDHH